MVVAAGPVVVVVVAGAVVVVVASDPGARMPSAVQTPYSAETETSAAAMTWEIQSPQMMVARELERMSQVPARYSVRVGTVRSVTTSTWNPNSDWTGPTTSLSGASSAAWANSST